MMSDKLVISKLGHTWILDLDGTIVKHNGYKIDGVDTVIPEAKSFIEKIPQKDMIVIITSRKTAFKKETEDFLKAHNIRFDYIIYDAPYGERILVNDLKPSGLKTAYSINCLRDEWLEFAVEENELL